MTLFHLLPQHTCDGDCAALLSCVEIKKKKPSLLLGKFFFSTSTPIRELGTLESGIVWPLWVTEHKEETLYFTLSPTLTHTLQ